MFKSMMLTQLKNSVTPPPSLLLLLLQLLLGLLVFGLERAQGYAGEVTSFGNSWEGHNCGFTSLWGSYNSLSAKTYFAAINAKQWDAKMNCGRCARVTCTHAFCKSKGGQSLVVLITDQCPECKYGDLDLSDVGFKKLTGGSPSRYTIEWDFVECPDEFVKGKIEYYVKDGSNPYWIALQPKNVKERIVQMEIKSVGNKWFVMTPPRGNHIDSLYFLAEIHGGLPSGPFSIRSTSESGKVIEDSFAKLAAGATLMSSSQFHANKIHTPSVVTPPSGVTVAPTTSSPQTTFPSPTPAPQASMDLSQTATDDRDFMQGKDDISSCAVQVKYHLMQWNGGFVCQIIFDNAADAWRWSSWEIKLFMRNAAKVDVYWNAQGRKDLEAIVLTSTKDNAVMPKGRHVLGFIGRKIERSDDSKVLQAIVLLKNADNKVDSECIVTSVGGETSALANTLTPSSISSSSTSSSSSSSSTMAIWVLIACVAMGAAVIGVAFYVRKHYGEHNDDVLRTPATTNHAAYQLDGSVTL